MSSKITLVTEQLREAREIEETTSGLDLFGADPSIVAVRVNGELRDLGGPVLKDVNPAADGAAPSDDAVAGSTAEVEPVAIDSPDGLRILRHSTAHVMAQAVQELHPDAKLGIGPPVTDGFYYDFEIGDPFTPDDLSAIQKQMSAIVKQKQRFVRREISDDEGRAELVNEPFKLELIQRKGSPDDDSGASVEVTAGQLTIYDNVGRDGTVAWKDLCQGPHVPHTGYIPAYAVTRSSAAYWLGDQANPQLQRVYGTAWPSKAELKDYQQRLAEAAKRDHRKLGAELDLFSFPEVLGSGLAVFHPKGGVLKKQMEDYVRRRHVEEGFSYVGTPHLTKDELFYTSGHLPKHADTMFPPMELEGAEYRVKPMNCPMHNLIYASRGRSYRELPLRLFEFGQVYRYERSGVVHGLTRVRGMTQDDSHSYVTHDQAPKEINHLLGFILGLLRDFGLDDYYLELSTRDPDSDKFIGTEHEWQTATDILEKVAVESGLELVPDPGGAAFYGPKISVQARDAIGRSWQLGTIQYDFNQPARFGLEYQAADGSRQQPVMIHSAKFGSIERFVGVLTEHYAGAFPPWLAPVQVTGIPVADEFVPYLEGVAQRLRAAGVRVEVDDSDDRMQKKIRNATKQKVPYQLIAGGQDQAQEAVSFRYRDGQQRNEVPVDEAITEITAAITELRQV